MINLQLTVREALWIISKCDVYDSTYEKILKGFEDALNIKHLCNVTITGGMSTNNRIHCIKYIRAATGWGLKESKDWTDVLVGGMDNTGQWHMPSKTSNTLTLSTPEIAKKLLEELRHQGCEGYLS